MSKIAFLFPGQGSQTVGMGQDLMGAFPAANDIAQDFNQVVTANTSPLLTEIVLNGPEEELKRTLYTQPAILMVSLLAFEAFRSACDLRPVAYAGHSLGEYGALYAAGVLDRATVIRLIQRRAELMEDAPAGAMSAVIGMNEEALRQVLCPLQDEMPNEVIGVANYNSPEQIVITGSKMGVEAANERLKAAGAKRVLPLPVGGAFHSSLMSPAAEAFAQDLAKANFAEASEPVISNIDGKHSRSASELRDKLTAQIPSSVRWTQTMESLVQDFGVDTVIEFGPGKVLAGMMKKYDRSVRTLNIYDQASLKATIQTLESSNLAPA